MSHRTLVNIMLAPRRQLAGRSSSHSGSDHTHSLTVLELVNGVLGCDARTRRARLLLLTASASATLVLAVLLISLSLVLSAAGALGGPVTTAVVGLAVRQFLRRRRGRRGTSRPN